MICPSSSFSAKDISSSCMMFNTSSSSSFISTACLLEPVLASVWGLLLFRERPGLQVMLGGALILLGIGLYSREEEQR